MSYFGGFPQELVEMIIDSSDSAAVFKACALVCKAWAPASRRNLFATTLLQSQEDMCKWSMAFASPLNQNSPTPLPNPSPLVSTLRICADWKLAAKDFTLFIPYLRSFTRVKKLIFLGLDLIGTDVWKFPELHFGHLAFSLRGLVLVRTVVMNSATVMQLVCMFPQLDDLSIRDLLCIAEPFHVCDECRSGSPIITHPPTFRGQLEINGGLHAAEFVHDMATLPLKFSSFKLLQMHPPEFDHWMELLSSCATTLKTLELSVYVEGNPHPIVPLRLSENHILERLTINLVQGKEYSSSLDWVTGFLSSVSSQNLSEVTFISVNPEADLADPNAWQEIEEKLLQLLESTYGRMKVLFKVAHHHLDEDRLAEMVKDALPCMLEEGALVYEVLEHGVTKSCSQCSSRYESEFCDCLAHVRPVDRDASGEDEASADGEEEDEDGASADGGDDSGSDSDGDDFIDGMFDAMVEEALRDEAFDAVFDTLSEALRDAPNIGLE